MSLVFKFKNNFQAWIVLILLHQFRKHSLYSPHMHPICAVLYFVKPTKDWSNSFEIVLYRQIIYEIRILVDYIIYTRCTLINSRNLLFEFLLYVFHVKNIFEIYGGQSITNVLHVKKSIRVINENNVSLMFVYIRR